MRPDFGQILDRLSGFQATVLNQDPLVAQIDDFIDPADCDALMRLGEGQMRRATVAGVEQDETHDSRTNAVYYIPDGGDEAATRLKQSVCALAGFPAPNAEPLQLIQYAPGAEYRAHYDSFDPKTDLGRRYWTSGGQRVVTGLAYLNAVTAGGETAFPKLGLSVAPKPGRLLLFQLCQGRGILPHDHSLHAGCPVEAGEKWAVNIWIRQSAFTTHIDPPPLDRLS